MILHGEDTPKVAGAKPKQKKRVAAASKPDVHQAVSLAPVIVEAGTRSRVSLRHLAQGSGPLMQEIGQIVHAVRAVVPDPASMVIVYQEQRSKGSNSTSLFDLFF